MANFKLAHLLPEIVADFRTIIEAYYEPSERPSIVAGLELPAAWAMLAVISRDRAYDDNHPAFVSGKWRRVLPFDGRDYCFYYKDCANDTHVETLLKNAIKTLQSLV